MRSVECLSAWVLVASLAFSALWACEKDQHLARRFDPARGCLLEEESVPGLSRPDSSEGGGPRGCLERTTDGVAFAVATGLEWSADFRRCPAALAERVAGAADCPASRP